MDPALVRQLVLGVVPPMLAGLVVFGALWWRREVDLGVHEVEGVRSLTGGAFARSRRAWWQDVLVVLMCMGVFFALFPRIFGKVHPWPGVSSDSALFWCAVIATGVGLFWSAVSNVWLRATSIVLSLSVCAWLAFHRLWFDGDSDDWNTLASIGTLALHVLLGGACVLGLALLAHRGRVVGVIGAVAALGLIAQVLVVSLASLKHGQGAGVFAAFLTFPMLFVLLRPARGLPAAVLAAIGLVVITQLALMSRFSDAPRAWLPVVLAMLGPVVGASVLWLLTRHERGSAPLRGLWRVLVPLAATLLPGLIGVGIGAYQALTAEQASDDYEY